MNTEKEKENNLEWKKADKCLPGVRADEGLM